MRNLRSDESGVLPLIPILLFLVFGTTAIIVSYIFFAKLFIATLLLVLAGGVLGVTYGATQENVIGERGFLAGLVVAVVLALVGVATSGLLFTAVPVGPPPDFDTDTRSPDLSQQFFGTEFRGAFVVGAAHEALDAPYYAGAFRTDASSDKIVWSAQVCIDHFQADFIIQSRLYIYRTTGTTWGDAWDVRDSGAPSTSSPGCQNFNTVAWTFSDFQNGWIRANLVVWTPGATSVCRDGCLVLTDDAELRSQAGTFVSPPEGRVYKPGDVVPVTVHIGLACSGSADGSLSDSRTESEGGGWTVEVIGEAQGRTVKQWDLGCGPAGVLPQDVSVDRSGARLEYQVTPADFDNSGGVCENTLSLRLYSNLFIKDQRDVKTVSLELSGQRPPRPTIQFSTTAPRAGQALTVTVVPDNSSLVKEYSISIAYTDGHELFRDPHSTTNTVTVTVPKDGRLVVTASVTSEECAASDPAQVTITVLPASGGPPPGLAELPWVFAIALVAIAALSAIGLLWYAKEEPQTDERVLAGVWVAIVALSTLGLIEAGLAAPWIWPPILVPLPGWTG